MTLSLQAHTHSIEQVAPMCICVPITTRTYIADTILSLSEVRETEG